MKNIRMIRKTIFAALVVLALFFVPLTMVHGETTESVGGQVTTEGRITFVLEETTGESKPDFPGGGETAKPPGGGRLPQTGSLVTNIGPWLLGILILFLLLLYWKKRQQEEEQVDEK